MALTRYNIIEIDATIIIGLLILLTFQSISSPFIEGESSGFSLALQESDRNLDKFDKLIVFCNEITKNPESFDQQFKEIIMYDVMDETLLEKEFQRKLPPLLYSKILDNCVKWEAQRFEIVNERQALEDWGIRYLYLNEFYGESTYLKNLATGPFYINVINLVMIFPFLISAIFESVKGYIHKDDESASKIGTAFMILGFLFVIIGLLVILYAFYEASKPFLI